MDEAKIEKAGLKLTEAETAIAAARDALAAEPQPGGDASAATTNIQAGIAALQLANEYIARAQPAQAE